MTEGERWAADKLEVLRAGRFTPKAWCRFLAESLRRAAGTRRARPQLARQAQTWSTLGLVSGVAACRAVRGSGVPAPSTGCFGLWWLVTAAMLDWHLGMVEGPDGETRERLSACDALTLLRLGSIPLVAAQGDPERGSSPAFSALITCAAATDTLDGVLARRAGTTRLGRDLDKVADSLLLGVGARAARRAGWLPPSAARLAILRSAVPVAFAAASYFRTGRRPEVDSLGPGNRLTPALLGGLGVSPFSTKAGAALTGAASGASLALGVVRPIAVRRFRARESCRLQQQSKIPPELDPTPTS